jgi:hypothetical protein
MLSGGAVGGSCARGGARGIWRSSEQICLFTGILTSSGVQIPFYITLFISLISLTFNIQRFFGYLESRKHPDKSLSSTF